MQRRTRHVHAGARGGERQPAGRHRGAGDGWVHGAWAGVGGGSGEVGAGLERRGRRDGAMSHQRGSAAATGGVGQPLAGASAVAPFPAAHGQRTQQAEREEHAQDRIDARVGVVEAGAVERGETARGRGCFGQGAVLEEKRSIGGRLVFILIPPIARGVPTGNYCKCLKVREKLIIYDPLMYFLPFRPSGGNVSSRRD